MSLSLHFHLVKSVTDALNEVFSENRYADKVIEKSFKQNRKWGARDRRFFAEAVYEIVRHRRYFREVAGTDRTWDLVAVYLMTLDEEIPDWGEFKQVNLKQISERLHEKYPAQVQHSFPDWLHELGQKEFGGEWSELMRALNKPAEVFLRANSLKINVTDLIAELKKEEIEAESVSSEKFDLPSALKLVKRKNVFVTQAFKKGFFEVQDAASQLVAPLLEVMPGMRVVDACAGAGGKSLHIAALMKNKGKLISMDIHEWKLKELKTRAARNSVDIIETKVIESSKTVKRLEESFDRVLLDVPCSGLGVVRRNPDTKWKLSVEEISRLQILQGEILATYSRMCKKGGQMVYATCSILYSENEEQIKKFLKENTNWQLVRELRVWPHHDGFDGFYAAVLSRQN